MNATIKNILAVIVGWLGGSIVNMSLVNTGNSIFPIEGLDMEDPKYMELLAEIMPTLDTEYFIFPFLAHAIGTLVGALIAGFMAATHKMKFAFSIGFLFLIGGILVNIMIGGPIWFAIVDILIAYIPMAWIGGKIALSFSKK